MTESQTQAKLFLDVYIRDGCHLCDDMIHVLSEYRNDYNFSIRLIDIDKDAELRSRYNTLVPVLCHGEEQICHHFFDLQALQSVVQKQRAVQKASESERDPFSQAD